MKEGHKVEGVRLMSGPKPLIAAALVAVATATLGAADVAIKLGTQAPTNSMWHKALLEMGSAWAKATEKRVTLQVYPDGRAGDEATTIRKMRPAVDSLQAGLLTIGGLAEIDDAFNAFGMPFFFESDEEELAVQKKLEPRLEQALQAKGFHLVAWGTGGWVQLFSKKPLRSLADVKSAKLFTSKGDDRMVQWYTRNGFNPVPLLIADIAPQLKLPTGMIDTAPNTAYLALTTQIYGDAKYMLDLHIAPLVGAMIMSNAAWNKISPEDQKKVTEAARAIVSAPLETTFGLVAHESNHVILYNGIGPRATSFMNEGLAPAVRALSRRRQIVPLSLDGEKRCAYSAAHRPDRR